MLVTSLSNNLVKDIMKLQQKKYRDEKGLYFVEGKHLVIEAFKSGKLEKLILEKNELFPLDVETVYITKEIMAKISEISTPANVMGICKSDLNNEVYGDRILILDGVQDPGNMGTIIRSAIAFKVDTIILGKECVDVYNSKVLRATQGMHFHINIVKKDILEVIPELQKNDFKIYGTDVEYGVSVKDFKSLTKYALVIGNEGEGISDEVKEFCDQMFYIDMNDNCESLNVAVATSIILYQLDK